MPEPDEITQDDPINQPPGPDRIVEETEPPVEDGSIEPIHTMRAANQPLGPHDS